jgi:hypothetical protein
VDLPETSRITVPEAPISTLRIPFDEPYTLLRKRIIRPVA